MARFHIAGRGSVVGTSARAIASLFAASTGGGAIREVSVTNTTTTEVCVGLIRFSAATNVGASAGTPVKSDPNSGPALMTPFQGHTNDGTTSGSPIRQVTLAAAKGSGWVWTFGAEGLRITLGTANGIGIYIPVGTGQFLDYEWVWDE